MKFHHAHCLLCGEYIFDWRQVLAYNCGQSIDLENKQPWAGVQCICLICASKVASDLRETEDEEVV